MVLRWPFRPLALRDVPFGDQDPPFWGRFGVLRGVYVAEMGGFGWSWGPFGAVLGTTRASSCAAGVLWGCSRALPRRFGVVPGSLRIQFAHGYTPKHTFVLSLNDIAPPLLDGARQNMKTCRLWRRQARANCGAMNAGARR